MDADLDDMAVVAAIRDAYSTDPDESPFELVPRMAYRLYSQARITEDLAAGDGVELAVAWMLPPIARRRATPELLGRFAQCFGRLADRLRSPGHAELLAWCVAEEVALHHVLRLAHGALTDGTELDVIGDALDSLPASPEHDTDFELYEDVLFKDRDFELLWSPQFDGIESDDTLIDALNLVNLHPDRWFIQFGNP